MAVMAKVVLSPGQAGNGNESVDNDGYASYEGVIAVAACNDKSTRSVYSDMGQALWCAFPSSNGESSFTKGIWTTDRSGQLGYNTGDVGSGDTAGNYTDSFGGTSSACPGVAALILSRNPSLRWDQVKDIIKQSCDQIDQANGRYSAGGHSPIYGYGRINALTAVKRALPPQPKYSVIHHVMQDIPIKDHKTSSLALEVGDKSVLKSIVVGLNVEHTYIGDLIIDLVAPSGSSLPTVRLHNKQGAGNDNLKREYDLASTPALGQLLGHIPEGQWRLRVKDTATVDTGKIKGFYLHLGF